MAVTNNKEFRAWLEEQPREVCVAIAHRAAMRVAGFVVWVRAEDRADLADRLALTTLRAMITSRVAAVGPTLEVRSAAATAATATATATAAATADAAAAAYAATDAADAAAAATAATADAAYAATAYAATAYAATATTAAFSDTDLPGGAVGIVEAANAVPEAMRAEIAAYAKDGRINLLEQGGPWAFWAEWYDRAMAGDPLPWDLQQKIALIPDDIWEAGPEAVAEEIKRIQLEYVAKSLPQAGGIAFDEEAGLFRKVTAEVARPSLLSATLAQIEGALEDVLADPSNGLHDRSREVQVLRRMLDRHGNDPQRIEMDCTSVFGSLTRQLAGEDAELPPSEQNLALREAVHQAAEGIRATDPEIAENRLILSEVKLRDISEDDWASFEQALPVFEAVSDAELGGEFREDVEDLADRLFNQYRPAPEVGERNPGIRAAYEEEIRLFKRIADMAILAKTKDIAVKCAQQIKKEPISFLGLLAGLIGIAVALF